MDRVDSGGVFDTKSTDIQWTALSLLHVEYVKGDYVGYILAWSSMVPIFLLISFGTLVFFKRDLHILCYLIGLLLNEAFNWILKHTVKEYRPATQRKFLTTEYGMPSSHTQLMSFFSAYLVICFFVRFHHNHTCIDYVWKYGSCIGAYTITILVACSRVYLQYHTVSQVLWGAVAGSLLGSLWFAMVHFTLTPVFPAIISSPLGELLMLRDSTPIPNLLWFEYTSSRSEARSRQRKSVSRKQ